MARIILLLFIHVFADYIFQGKKMSNLKMLKLPSLLQHVATYTFFLIVFSPFALSLTFLQALAYSLINGALHLGVDFITGRLKNHFMDKDESKYLAVIGIDHTLHLAMLISTYGFLFPEAFSAIPYY